MTETFDASAHLRALLAAEGGSTSVERFMQEALYHPRFGYYARRVGTVGRAGDFSTSATLHPALGQAIAAWAATHRGEVNQHGRWHLIELGGGTGELAEAVLPALGWRARLGLRYHLVEVSEPLRAQQQARLGTGGAVRWHGTIQSALATAGGRALIFSNEFADAFPCAQLVWNDAATGWQEVRVAWPEGAPDPVETTTPWRGALPSATAHVPLRAGQRVETLSSYRRWLADLAVGWHAGRLLTVDYGNTLPALYHRQPHGTLRAYCRHQRFTGPEVYRRFGQQDLTADVNFTDLQSWGDPLGLATTRYETQAEFLRRLLPARTLRRQAADPALAFLLDSAGAGGSFKVLEQLRRAFPA